MGERALPSMRDGAVSELVSTLLLVLLAVVLGSVVAIAVSAKLAGPAATPASFAIDPPEAGDVSLRVVLRHGGPLAVGDLQVTLHRGASSAEVPSASWGVAHDTLAQGDALRVPLDPPLAAGEGARVVVAQRGANVVLADLEAFAPRDAAASARATLNATFDPPTLRPDGASTSVLAVRLTHPHGALMVASVTADLQNVTRAGRVAPRSLQLADDGRSGDAQGGDGVWSAAVALPTTTPDGLYAVPVRAFDALGREIGSTLASLVVSGGSSATLGSSFNIPSSENVTHMEVTNFTYDATDISRLDHDALQILVLEGSNAWSVTFFFEERGGVAYIIEMRVTGNASETILWPTDQRIALDGLRLDLLDPAGDGSWYVKSGAPLSQTLYPHVGMPDGARLSIVYVGDVASGRPSDVAMRSVDVVVR